MTQPRPGAAHARTASRLGMDVGGPFDRGRGGPGGWLILDEPELHLGPDVLVPDLAGWRRERMPELPNTAAFTLAPGSSWLRVQSGGGDETLRAEPFDAIELELAAFWER